MSNPRDYAIEIRDAAQEYLNGQHRFYANMSSSETAGDDGVIKLRIAYDGKQIELTPSEAKHIGDALVGAAQGALSARDRVVGDVVDNYGRHLKVTQSMLENGGDRINFGLALYGDTEMKRLQAALLKAYPLDVE